MTYVSRAGEKLEKALEVFDVNVKDKVCVDLGACTGGFTDCLLQKGAKKVYSVEKGYGTIEWKIRQNEKVVVMERKNALHVELPEKVDIAVIDIGWTKQEKIIPKALELVSDGGVIISLLKPHYEAQREELYKGKVKEDCLNNIVDRVVASLNTKVEQVVESPVVGSKGGNKEYLMLIKKN
jgi:23S rRNA (cytidine1920-2'-O)/16S rRNA (cytidine1409-2'-O)-methyltransferase